VIVRASLAHRGHGVGEGVNGGARKPLRIPYADGFVPLASAVLEGGCGAAHDGDALLEHIGEGVTWPGRGHRYREPPALWQTGGPRRERRVRGVERSDSDALADPQGDTDSDHPEAAVGKRCLVQGRALQHPSRCEAEARASWHPVHKRWRTWRFLDTQSQSAETEDTRDGAKAPASASNHLEGDEDEGHLGLHGTALTLALQWAQARLGLFACWGSAVSLVFAPRHLLAQVALLIGSLRRLGCPWRSAVSALGSWAHHVRAGEGPPLRATGGPSVIGQMKMTHEERALRGGMPLPHERDGRPMDPADKGTRVTYHRWEAKPIAGAQGRFCGEASAP